MSPNDDLLSRLRSLTQVEEPSREQWHELVELFDALDANLSGGGPLPTVWTAEYIRAQLRRIAAEVTAEVYAQVQVQCYCNEDIQGHLYRPDRDCPEPGVFQPT